jgi:hypothetical protein
MLDSVTVPGEPQQEEATPRTRLESAQKYALIENTGMPKECVRLMDRYENGQVFFSNTPHPWLLKPLSELSLRQVSSDKFRMFAPAVHFMDLADGRAIAYVAFSLNRFERSDWWIIVRPARWSGISPQQREGRCQGILAVLATPNGGRGVLLL